jgi:hypothetical protein
MTSILGILSQDRYRLCPHKESNLGSRLRSAESYPLNDRGNSYTDVIGTLFRRLTAPQEKVRVTGIEPIVTQV